MAFNQDAAIQVANHLYSKTLDRHLSDIELAILKGSWERLEYDQIAAQNLYATSYVSQDAAPKLWKNLGEALGEKIRKSNFKAALKRYWEANLANQPTVASSQQSFRNGASTSQPEAEASISETYVRRPELETVALETLQEPGSLVRIKAPRFMGKTTLATYLLAQLQQQGYRNVLLSFELADRQTHFTQLNRFLRWFCLNIGRELGLANQLDEFWDEEGIGAKVSCTTYFEEYLLDEIDTDLVLCLDDVDLLFPYPAIYEDFFGLLRSWHEKAKRRKIWQKLRLVIAHATEVYIRLNINQSPFNVGVPLEIPELTQSQTEALAKQHGLLSNEPSFNQTLAHLTDWVGGHPYLLEQAFLYLRQHPTTSVEQLLQDVATDSGLYRNHLHEHWLNLQDSEALMTSLVQVVQSSDPVELNPAIAYQLQSMGLVQMSGNLARPRLKLYQEYFRDRLTVT